MFGKFLLGLSAGGQRFGPLIADFNETHVLNPRWPGHSRFHNGQTMSMGACLSLLTLYYTFRPTPNVEAKKDSVFTTVVFGSVYWITGLSAILYPGSKAVDPEFGDPQSFPQFWIFLGFFVSSWVGRGFERGG
jgi:hypothetical protein